MKLRKRRRTNGEFQPKKTCSVFLLVLFNTKRHKLYLYYIGALYCLQLHRYRKSNKKELKDLAMGKNVLFLTLHWITMSNILNSEHTVVHQTISKHDSFET
jgi:hypothetical protein